ncbi:MAG: UPF0147 family protein [Anaerolineales bacterium]
METQEELEQICDMLDRIEEDTSIPRNIRNNSEECEKLLLESDDDLDVRIASSIFKLEEMADDPNIPLHGRTLIWNVISRLESLDRVFPKSEDAREVRDALWGWIKEQGVQLITNAPVTDLLLEDKRIKGVTTERKKLYAPAVIIATGGAAYPGTGSTGDGYALARKAGHTIIPVRPALVPLVTASDTAPQLQGLSLRNVQVNLWVNGDKADDLFGEMLFTHFGLSGPIILTLSRQIVDYLRADKSVVIAIDLKPALDHPTLRNRLLRDIEEMGRKQFSTLLEGLLPKKLIPVCVNQTGIPWDKKNNQITAQERKRLRMWLKEGFRFQITDHRSFDQAIITAGGVDTREVDPQTMESKLVRGLFFAGEVLDVNADTGGYNLQAAFSTGWAAGRAAASSLNHNTRA